MLFVGGAVKLQRASLALHAFFAGLQHIRLYALPGGLGSGADGVADGLNGAGADAVAFGVVNVVVPLRESQKSQKNPKHHRHQKSLADLATVPKRAITPTFTDCLHFL